MGASVTRWLEQIPLALGTARPCVRGCTVRGAHFAACLDFGIGGPGECTGCVPAAAADDVLVCERCLKRLRYALDNVPDVLALIRSKADPLKAAVYDRERTSGGTVEGAPAPVAADLLDASDAIMATLARWSSSRRHLPPGADAEEAHDIARGWVEDIDLMFVANRDDLVLALWADLFEVPEDPEVWSVARAVARHPLADRSWWAAAPCPDCGYQTVRVSPPRQPGRDSRFECSTCQWLEFDRDAVDEGDGFWFEVFNEKRGRSA